MSQTRKSWRSNFGAAEVIQRIRPLESNDYLPNPHRGTTTFQRFQGDPLYIGTMWDDNHGPMRFKPAPKDIPDNNNYIAKTTLSYCRWAWKDLEPQDGNFRWPIMDKALKAARTRGQTLQIRLQPYTALNLEGKELPKVTGLNNPVNLPTWVWQAGCKWQRDGGHSLAGDHCEPDCNDPVFIKYFARFLKAFAQRYDGHPDLESIDVVCGGAWGEGGGNATAANHAYFNSLYLKAFKKTQLVLMMGSAHHMCKVLAQTNGKNKTNPGWRADCFGSTQLRPQYYKDVPKRSQWHHMYQYPYSLFDAGLQNAWEKAPVTLETCHAVAQWYDFISKDEYLEDLDWIIEQGYKYHMSVFMPKSILFPEATLKKLSEFDKKIGYRFMLRQLELPLDVTSHKKIIASVFLDNLGCAPIYRDYRCTLRLSQGKTQRFVHLKSNVRDWMPGIFAFSDSFILPKGFKKGQIDVDIALCDDDNKLRVQFANEGRDAKGWTATGAIQHV